MDSIILLDTIPVEELDQSNVDLNPNADQQQHDRITDLVTVSNSSMNGNNSAATTPHDIPEQFDEASGSEDEGATTCKIPNTTTSTNDWPESFDYDQIKSENFNFSEDYRFVRPAIENYDSDSNTSFGFIDIPYVNDMEPANPDQSQGLPDISLNVVKAEDRDLEISDYVEVQDVVPIVDSQEPHNYHDDGDDASANDVDVSAMHIDDADQVDHTMAAFDEPSDELESIMSDHTYSNQPEKFEQPPPANNSQSDQVEQNNPATDMQLDDLLRLIPSKIAVLPEDGQLKLLSLVTSLLTDEKIPIEIILSDIQASAKAMKSLFTMDAQHQNDNSDDDDMDTAPEAAPAVSATAVEPVNNEPNVGNTCNPAEQRDGKATAHSEDESFYSEGHSEPAEHRVAIDQVNCEMSAWTDSVADERAVQLSQSPPPPPEKETALSSCLEKLRVFGQNIGVRNALLLRDINANVSDAREVTMDTNICTAFVTVLEKDFKDLLKDLKLAMCLSKPSASAATVKLEKSAEEKAEAARKLNEKSKERLLASSSSDNDGDHQHPNEDSLDSSVLKRRRRKRRQVLSTSVSDELAAERLIYEDSNDSSQASSAAPHTVEVGVELPEKENESQGGCMDDGSAEGVAEIRTIEDINQELGVHKGDDDDNDNECDSSVALSQNTIDLSKYISKESSSCDTDDETHGQQNVADSKMTDELPMMDSNDFNVKNEFVNESQAMESQSVDEIEHVCAAPMAESVDYEPMSDEPMSDDEFLGFGTDISFDDNVKMEIDVSAEHAVGDLSVDAAQPETNHSELDIDNNVEQALELPIIEPSTDLESQAMLAAEELNDTDGLLVGLGEEFSMDDLARDDDVDLLAENITTAAVLCKDEQSSVTADLMDAADIVEKLANELAQDSPMPSDTDDLIDLFQKENTATAPVKSPAPETVAEDKQIAENQVSNDSHAVELQDGEQSDVAADGGTNEIFDNDAPNEEAANAILNNIHVEEEVATEVIDTGHGPDEIGDNAIEEDDVDDEADVVQNGEPMSDGGADEEDSVDADDRDIDRLLDFTSLTAKKKSSDVYYEPKKKKEPIKSKKEEKLTDMVANSVHNLNDTADSNSESDEEIITEQQYLQQCNINTKEKLLNLLSSDSDASGSSSDDEDDNMIDGDEMDGADGNDSDDLAINKFLANKLKIDMEPSVAGGDENVDEHETEMDDIESPLYQVHVECVLDEDGVEKQQLNHSDDVIEAITGAEEAKATAEDVVVKPNTEQSNVVAPQEESAVDVSSPKEKSSEHGDSDDDDDIENIANTTLTKEVKQILGNSLFNNLDEFKKKNSFTLDDNESLSDHSSLSSDCEILDTSMFKNDHKDIDEVKMAKKMKTNRKQAQAKAAVADDCISLSSDTDLDLEEPAEGAEEQRTEKNRGPRRMLRADELAGETKLAQREEADRVKRLEKKVERMTQVAQSQESAVTQSTIPESDVVLDHDTKKKTNITVHPDIVKYLKEHQVDGVKFMYDSCYGSVDCIEKFPGSGCILAHCMGLGKTLQLIALLHTVIRHPQLKTNKVLVICPKSTVMNWADEIERWLRPVRDGPSIKVYHFPDSSDLEEKLKVLRRWHNSGKAGYSKAGCLLIGYEAFRALALFQENKKRCAALTDANMKSIRNRVEETLLKPGADLVICDEGHTIKNPKSATSRAVNLIKTKRRIILTGTPIQNNLKEYYSMVNFIKPSFLGTEKEFSNLYATPIRIGQHKDSSRSEIKFMKQRSYVLHKKLSRFVQRREAALLKTFLPEKYEYVLFIPMTDVQNRLYEHFLGNNPLKEKYGGKSLIPDYTFLRKIWTHPKVLENAWQNARILAAKKREQKMVRLHDSEDEQPDDVLDSQTGDMSVTSDWWRPFVTQHDLESLLPSNKLRTLFEILKMCQENGEKCLIFSAFVAVLNVVEYFMTEIHKKSTYAHDMGLDRFHGPWELSKDYYRLDGKTPRSIRHTMITKFNDPTNTQTKCFLISAKAGGQGINLIGANRVILLDTSWNPSQDQQNIFRVFRLGQKSKCYIYRLLAMGTMEEKVYSRSVTKQAMSFRVVDEQQIDRHYSMAELAELYTLTVPDYSERPTPVRPYDNVLANLLHNFPELVYKYHEHDSLLEKNSEQDLSEEEKADAWAAYENDVSLKNQMSNNLLNLTDGLFNTPSPYGGLNIGMHPYNTGYGAYANTAQNLNYLSSLNTMGYPTGTFPNKEMMLLSQMYSSQYSNLIASSARGDISQASLNAALSNYPPSLFGSSAGSIYNAAGIMTAATSPSPYAASSSSNVYSSPASTNYGTLSSSAASSSLSSLQQNMMAMPSYLPSFSNLKSGQASGSSSSAAAAAGSASAATAGSSSMSGRNAKAPRFDYNNIDNNMWSYLNSPRSLFGNVPSNLAGIGGLIGMGSKSSTESPTSSSVSPSLASTQQPGPNAIKNPLLSKELSMPSAGPVVLSSNAAVPNSNSSIPTSVITKTSNLPTVGGGPLVINNETVSRVAMNSNRSSPSSTSLSRLNSPPPAHRNSPNVTANANNTISITGASSRTSPEPHLIVKNVNAINQSINKAASASTSSSVTKSNNMGIVYPKKVDPNKFDLSQNTKLLKAAQSQFNSLSMTAVATSKAYTTSSSGVGRPTQAAMSPQPTPRVGGSHRGSTNDKYRIIGNTSNNRGTPVTTTIQGANNPATTFIRRPPVEPATLPTKSIISVPTSEVTITPTGKKMANTNSITIRSVNQTPATTITPSKHSMATFSPVNKQNISSTTPTTTTGPRTATNKKPITSQMLKQQQTFGAKKQIQSNATISVSPAANVTQIGSSTLTRQNTAPVLTGNINSIRGRVASAAAAATTATLQSINGAKNNQRTVPPLVRQNTVPTLKAFTPGGGSPAAAAGPSRITVRQVGSTNSTTTGSPVSTTKSQSSGRVANSNRPVNQTAASVTTATGQSSVLRAQAQRIVSPASAGRVSSQPTVSPMQQSRAAIRTVSSSNPNRTVHNSPPALVSRTTTGTTPTAALTPTTPVRLAQQQMLRQQLMQQKLTTLQNPAQKKISQAAAAATMAVNQRKRKINELSPSVSITEIKKPKTSNTGIALKDATKLTKKPNSFEGITILPRNPHDSQSSQRTKANNFTDIVELD